MPQNGEDRRPRIRLVDVRKTYRMGEVDVPVLRGVDLDLYEREITVVHGPSGSGKSTLLNIIGGVDRPTGGEVWFGERDIAALGERALTEYRRRNVGFVFQFYNLVPTLTARENVEVSTEISSDAMDAAEALGLVGLGDRLDSFPAQLSGGEQQRVAIARALAKRPVLMLCDEPTGALDVKTGQVVLGLLTRLNEELGATIVIFTHATPIGQLAHKVLRIGSGRIMESGVNPKRLAAQEIFW